MNPRKKSSKLEGRRPFIGIPATGIICLAFLFNLACDRKTETSQKEVMIEVLDPRGRLVSPEVAGLSNPRINDLNGKKIALMADKPDAILFFNSMEKLFKKAYPTATILRFPSPASPIQADNTAEVAAACDVWLEGVKTATSVETDYDIRLEKLGKPGAAFSVNSLIPQRRSLAEINGMPTIRIISLPDKAYLKAKANQELMDRVASEVFDDTVKALTAPLTKSEKEPVPFYHDYSTKKFTGSSFSEAIEKYQQYCHENFMSDGLPVVPPTREAVNEMLAGTSLKPSEEIGIMYPRKGMATVEKIAINSVMAGAKPEYLPIIITAIECITDKNFCQYHIVTGPLPVIWISGPIIEEVGMNNNIGYLSPGYRANSTIGRAIAMCMINIGWREMNIYAMPGGPGTPIAYTNYLIPENQKENPWESFSVEHGYKPEESTVSVNETLWVSNGPGETLNFQTFEQSMESLANLFIPSGFFGNTASSGYRYELVLHPTMASQLADAGFTKQSLVQWIYDKTSVNWNKMDEEERKRFKESVAQGQRRGIRLEDCKPGLLIEPFVDPKHVAVIVAGNAVGQTMVYTTAAGSTTPRADSPPDFVERPFMTKVIRGATLTKSGR